MLGFQLRPGAYQVPRQTLRHWPVLTATTAISAVSVAAFSLSIPVAPDHVRLHLASAADLVAAQQVSFARVVGKPFTSPPADAAPKAEAVHAIWVAAHIYRVHRGDTLRSIAKRKYGDADRWPALWWVNKHKVHNPLALRAGVRLHLSAWHPWKRWLLDEAVAAIPRPVVRHHSAARTSQGPVPAPVAAPAQSAPVHAGVYSFSQLEALWIAAGGPSGAASQMAGIAECESGGNPNATNDSSGAAGLWQILGNPFPGDPYDPMTNARMAVAKYNAAGGTSPWVCQ